MCLPRALQMCVRVEHQTQEDRNAERADDAGPAGVLGGADPLGGRAADGGTPAVEGVDVGVASADTEASQTRVAAGCAEGEAAAHEVLGSGGTLIRGPRVQQDLWHILDRIISPAHVANGGYGPWCLNLSKAFAIPNPEYLAALKAVIQKRHPAWTDGQVECSLYGRYASARHRHVPTVVPPPPVLSERVQKVADAFNPVTDVKTGAD